MVAPSVAPVTKPREPLANALQRLAAKAHAEGVVVLGQVGTAAPFAFLVSSSRPGHEPYFVNLEAGHLHGCDCQGYFRHQRCKHYALCLDVAGWLPDPPDDPPPGAPAPLAALPRSARRALAAADLAARFPSQHPARSEDLAVA